MTYPIINFLTKGYIITLFFTTICFRVAGQSLDNFVINSAGNVIHNSDIEISYSIGEGFVGYFESDQYELTEGFLQPDDCNVKTSSITGLNSVFENMSEVTYSVTSTTGSSYSWTTPSGMSIISGQGTSTLKANFVNFKEGSVSVIETNSEGCAGDVVTYQIKEDLKQYFYTSNINEVENCSGNLFKVAVNVTSVPSGIIGFDIRIPFDPTLIKPSGNIFYGKVLTTVGVPLQKSTFTTTISGQPFFIINVYASFSNTNEIAIGFGKILDVEFSLQQGISTQTLTFTGSLSEAYINYGTDPITITSTIVSVIPNDQRKLLGSLYASNQITKPINGTGSIKTLLSGTSSGTIAPTVLQTILGNTFIQNIPMAYDGISLLRDIPNGTILTPVVNSADASLVQKIVNNLPPYNTGNATVLELMAADVNSDRRVSLSDWILIQQRIINTIQSFPNTPDWKFIESSRITTFTGQTNFNFPYANTIIEISPVVNTNGCTNLGNRTITGILSGDVNASWNTVANASSFRRNNETISDTTLITYKANEATYLAKDIIKIPVYASNANFDIESFDLQMDYDEIKLSIEDVLPYGSSENQSLLYNDFNKDILLISNISYSSFDKTKPLAYITFKGQSALLKNHFKEIKSYVNGNLAQSKFDGLKVAISDSVSAIENEIKVFPNPSDNGEFILNYLGKGTKTLNIYNSEGKKINSYNTDATSFYHLSLSGCNSGLYLLEVIDSKKRVILKLNIN